MDLNCDGWFIKVHPVINNILKRRIFEPIFGTNLNSERTDLFNIPIVDEILFWLTRFESILIKEMNIPFGSSVVILAKK